MRKWLGMIIIMLAIMLVYSDNLLAAGLPFAEEDCLETSSDFSEIQLLEDDICNIVAGLGGNSKPKDIKFSKAAKIYIDTDIIKIHSKEQDDILNALKDSNYVWVIPIETEDEIYEVTLARGLPLSDDAKAVLTLEEQEEVRNNEGKWHVTSSAEGENTDNYIEELLDYGEQVQDYSRIIIVGSQPGMQMPIAIGFHNEEAVSWISLGYQYPVIMKEKNTISLDSGIYDFENISASAEKYENRGMEDSIVSGFPMGKGLSWKRFVIILDGCVLTIAVILIIAKKIRSSK